MAGVTGIWQVTTNAGSFPGEHTYYGITYSDGHTTTIEYGPNSSNQLSTEDYNSAAFSQLMNSNDLTASGAVNLSLVAESQYGSLNDAANALLDNASNLDQNLQLQGISYDPLSMNCNTAAGALGIATFGIDNSLVGSQTADLLVSDTQSVSYPDQTTAIEYNYY